MLILSKTLIRPANVPALIGYSLGMGMPMQKYLGIGFKDVVFFVQSGSMTEYRSEIEMKKLEKMIKRIFFYQPEKVNKILIDFKKNYSDIEDIYRQSTKINNRKTKKEIIKMIGGLENSYRAIWAPVLFSYWLPIWLDSKKLSQINKKRLQKIIRARYDKDKEYVYALKFYDNIFLYFLKNISKECSFELCTPKELISFLKGNKCFSKDIILINKRGKGCIVFSDKVIALGKISKKEISIIADFLKRGKVIVYPTDTIYGLGCLATNKKAIQKIYKIKKREKGKPLIILVSNLAMLKKYCYVSKEQEEYLREIWLTKTLGVSKRHRVSISARPMTVILKSKGILPHELSGSKHSLAVRLPKNDFLIKIIKEVKAPIVSTSANISGEEYKGALEKINKLFGNKIDLIVNAGKLKNKPSRIVDIREMDNIRLIRK
jgi:L-threonylcarbamoyladenylate synthase